MKTQHKNLWDAGKAVLTGTFIAVNSCIKKEDIWQKTTQYYKAIILQFKKNYKKRKM